MSVFRGQAEEFRLEFQKGCPVVEPLIGRKVLIPFRRLNSADAQLAEIAPGEDNVSGVCEAAAGRFGRRETKSFTSRCVPFRDFCYFDLFFSNNGVTR
jgi:hypothetical protein